MDSRIDFGNCYIDIKTFYRFKAYQLAPEHAYIIFNIKHPTFNPVLLKFILLTILQFEVVFACKTGQTVQITETSRFKDRTLLPFVLHTCHGQHLIL
jgi:hypothetical protein